MINFSKISASSNLGRLLRYCLKGVPSTFTMRVLQGPAQGMKWVVGSGDHGCWLGTFELNKQTLLRQFLRPGLSFFDIGANVGFYTLLAAKLVGVDGQVVAFEPNPANLHYLERHVALNQCRNVLIKSCALSNQSGILGFDTSQSRSMGHLTNGEGSMKVKVAILDELLASEEILKPDIIKIDVEGEEYKVLLGSLETLRSCHPTIFLATHGPEIHQQCLFLLDGLGYKIQSVEPLTDYRQTDEIVAVYDSSIRG